MSKVKKEFDTRKEQDRKELQEAVDSLLDCTVTKDEKIYLTKVKVISSGPITELYTFTYPIRIGFDTKKHKSSNPRIRDEKDESERNEEYRKRTARRARNDIRRLALSNFSNKATTKFLTLTLRDNCPFDIRDPRDCNKEFKKFIQKLNYYVKKNFPDFQSIEYIAVIQFQDKNNRGAVHYHLLINIPFIEHNVITDIWRHGFIYVNKIDHVDNVGAYISAYLLKNFQDPRLKGEKCYFTSKGLRRSKVLYGEEAEQLIRELMLDKRKPTYENSYDSEYNGEVSYQEFNDNRDITFYEGKS